MIFLWIFIALLVLYLLTGLGITIWQCINVHDWPSPLEFLLFVVAWPMNFITIGR